MGKINKEWHLANRMPIKPTENQRAKWHLDHASNCNCREMTDSIRQLIKKFYSKENNVGPTD